MAILAGPRPGPLTAQGGNETEDLIWRLEGLRIGYCVQLLVDSAAAAEELPAGFVPVRADRAPALHPALRSVVEGQPEFLGWTPSRLCVYYLDAVEAGDIRVTNKSLRKSQMIGVWSLTAADAQYGGPQDLAVELLSGSGRLVGAATRAGIPVREVRASMGKVPSVDDDGVPSTDDRYQFKRGKTLVTWDGRPAGDSAAVEGAVESGWSAEGRRGELWSARMVLSPLTRRGMVGSIRIEGKDGFAKALKASPIRFVGPLYQGGGGEIKFSLGQGK